MDGCFSFVLHTHMPYVRKNGAWPVGEDWLYEVMSETYIPLLEMLARLEDEGLEHCLALTMTPVLCEQLSDPYIKSRFVEYLETMLDRATADARDFEYFEDPARGALAEEYRRDFRRKLEVFEGVGRDLPGALASFEERGLVETLASCATHAFLPAMPDYGSVREQVLLGIESHRRHLGRRPRGFWIPECAYRSGLEGLLQSEGIEYFVVDSSALAGLPPGRPYTVGRSGVTALARSDRAHENAWDEDSGYPTDGRYMDSTKYYQGSGLHYWRVTGRDVGIDFKEVYRPEAARRRALDHADHFIGDVASEIADLVKPDRRPGADATRWIDQPLVLACYDTEFFGHGWKEGFYWLELTLRSLAGCGSIDLTVPSLFLRGNAERGRVDLLETTWGTGRDDSTWLNPGTGWMWKETGAARERLLGLLAERSAAREGSLERRALEQAAREVLLLESSDWSYMVAKDRARDYAIERFRCHLERFERLANALDSGAVAGAEAVLGEIEEADRLFGRLDLSVVSGGDGFTEKEGGQA